MAKIRIAIVEDHAMFREGITSLLGTTPDMEIVGEYHNGEVFVNALPQLLIDVVLLDIEMPVMNGIETARYLKKKNFDCKILALSMHENQNYCQEMITLGIKGFVSKSSGVNVLKEAIRKVHNNEACFPAELLQSIIVKMNTGSKREPHPMSSIKISDREMEVLAWVCEGLTNFEISEKMLLSLKTIESHKTKLIKKTSSQNNAGLILFAIKNKLVEI